MRLCPAMPLPLLHLLLPLHLHLLLPRPLLPRLLRPLRHPHLPLPRHLPLPLLLLHLPPVEPLLPARCPAPFLM